MAEQEEHKEVPTGPTPGQVATAKALADALARQEERDAEDVAENQKAKAKTEAPIVKDQPVFVDTKPNGKPGKPHFHMDLLNASIGIDARLRDERLGLREPVKGKPAPQLVPGERPVQPVGTTVDKAARPFSHEAHARDPDADQKPAAVWSPDAQQPEGKAAGWTTKPV